MEQKSSGFCDTCRVPQGEKPEQIRTAPLLSEGWDFFTVQAEIFLASEQAFLFTKGKLLLWGYIRRLSM